MKNNFGLWAVLVIVLYFLFGIATWLFLALRVVSPWLVSLGLVAWASAIVSLVGIGVVCFWVFFFGFLLIAGVLATFGD